MIGLVRRSSLVFRTRIEHRNRELSMLRSDFYVLAYGDMSDGSSLRKVMNRLNAARFTKS